MRGKASAREKQRPLWPIGGPGRGLCSNRRLQPLAYRRGDLERMPPRRMLEHVGGEQQLVRSMPRDERRDTVPHRADRKRAVLGKSVSVRVDTGGRRLIQTKDNNKQTNDQYTS